MHSVFGFAAAAAAVVVGLIGAAPADAVIVRFDDAERAENYAVGETFTSEGVDFEVAPYVLYGSLYSDGFVTVGSIDWGPSVPLPGEEPVVYPGNANLDIDFAGSVGQLEYLTIQFFDGGGTVNLLINGEQSDRPIEAADFFAFDGTTINGVEVSIFDLSGVYEEGRGRIDLTGPIDRVVIGGQETLIDNLRGTVVPEPASLAMLLGGGLLALCRRRRVEPRRGCHTSFAWRAMC